MRFVDVLLALPGILFAMAMIAVLGRSQTAALVAVGITGIPSFARVTRAQVLSLRKRDFVTAVEAFGGSSTYNMFRTVLPNAWSPILVQVVVLSSVAILLEAALVVPRRRHPAADAELGRDAAHRQGLSARGADLRGAARPRADADDPVLRHHRPGAAALLEDRHEAAANRRSRGAAP